jgi:hypothetical protein
MFGERVSVRLVELRGTKVALVHDAVVHPASWLCAVPHLRELTQVSCGGPDGVGERHRLQLQVPTLPALEWDLETVRVTAPRLVEWRVEGDLEGTGLWELEQRGAITDIRSVWQVHPSSSRLQLAASLASVVVAREHDAVLRTGLRALAEHLGGELLTYQVPRRGHRHPVAHGVAGAMVDAVGRRLARHPIDLVP